MKLTLRFISLAALIGLASAGSVFAAELPKEGNYDFTSCWSGVSNTISFSKTHSAYSFEMTGVNRSNPPGGLFDKVAFRCVGMNASFDGKVSATAVCEGVDPDGDKRLTYFSFTPDGKITRQFISGTGKYEGMVETNSNFQSLGPFPVVKEGTIADCNHQRHV
jgi:hypothetical protein